MSSILEVAIEEQFGATKDTQRDNLVDLLSLALIAFNDVGDGVPVKVDAMWKGKSTAATIFRKGDHIYFKVSELWHEIPLSEAIIDEATEDDFKNYKEFMESVSQEASK